MTPTRDKVEMTAAQGRLRSRATQRQSGDGTHEHDTEVVCDNHAAVPQSRTGRCHWNGRKA
eukprot:2567546-Rhodomonas_salina.1